MNLPQNAAYACGKEYVIFTRLLEIITMHLWNTSVYIARQWLSTEFSIAFALKVRIHYQIAQNKIFKVCVPQL